MSFSNMDDENFVDFDENGSGRPNLPVSTSQIYNLEEFIKGYEILKLRIGKLR